MREIILKRGEICVVDDEDYEDLAKHKWYSNSDGYVVRGFYVNGKTKLLRMHRCVMNPPPHLEIDHINHNKLDNRKENLRVCTHHQNQFNQGIQANNTSGYRGVYWRKDENKWRAQIGNFGRRIYLGSFTDKHEAVRAYNKKAIQLYGIFAQINNISDNSEAITAGAILQSEGESK